MERFKKIYQQGTIDVIEIWVDTQNRCKLCFPQKWKCSRIYAVT